MDSISSEDKYWEERLPDSHDDWGGDKTFLESYRESASHPHRQLVIEFLQNREFNSLLEVGCCNGPNLYLLKKNFPDVFLEGTDANKYAVDDVINWLQIPALVQKLPKVEFPDKSFDYVLADACLMYVKDIEKALSEMKRVAKKGVIIFDWETENEEKINYSYTRNWKNRLEQAGFKDIEIKQLTEQQWPNQKWQEYGRLITCQVQ